MFFRILVVVAITLISFLIGLSFGTDTALLIGTLGLILSGAGVLIENALLKQSGKQILVTSVFLILFYLLLLPIGDLIIIPFLEKSLKLEGFNFQDLQFPIRITLALVATYLGVVTGWLKGDDIDMVTGSGSKTKTKGGSMPKILDTSVIIDGRIADISETGFLEGPLIVPKFVLKELQQVADSSDPLKRSRGRRGLDILNKMKASKKSVIKITDKDFLEIREVDSKLLKMAQFFDGVVITNDYNLNKVAEFQGVRILNINELSNAVKPVVLPNEELKIVIIKEGKDQNQGIAYLDDGTMIVVDNGKDKIGQEVTVIVTSILQTPAGRMIFTQLEHHQQNNQGNNSHHNHGRSRSHHHN